MNSQGKRREKKMERNKKELQNDLPKINKVKRREYFQTPSVRPASP